MRKEAERKEQQADPAAGHEKHHGVVARRIFVHPRQLVLGEEEYDLENK